MDRDPYNNYQTPRHDPNPYYNPDSPAPNPYYNPEQANAENNNYRENVSPYQRDINPYTNEGRGSEQIQNEYRPESGAYQYEQYRERWNADPLAKPYAPPRRRSSAATLVSILLFLLATGSGFLGLTGTLLGAAPSLPDAVLGVILIAQVIFSIVLLIIVLIKHKQPRMRTWLRLLFALGATVLAFIAAIIMVALSDPSNLGSEKNPLENVALGIVFLVYWIVVAFVALY
jgi:hypothetical protein